MSRDKGAVLYGKIGIGGIALVAMAFVFPATPIAPAAEADACGMRHSSRRPTMRTTKKKVKGRWELKISYYNKYYRFDGGSYRLKTVHVYTKSTKVADFIQKKASHIDFWKAVRAEASRFSCEDLLKGKQLAKLERGLANAIAKHYQKKTKKSAGKLDLMLGLYAPYRAYCKPTKKKIASRR
jgi:hypothetical protein